MTLPVYVWQPGTAAIAARAGISASGVIRADQNTSPFRPPWASGVARAATTSINEYPDAGYRSLRESIARYLEVDPEMVVPGAGADEMILLSAKAWLGPGDRAVAESPTYPLYRIATLQQGAAYDEVPRSSGEPGFPAGALAAAASGAALTWLCIPSNPVGDRADDAGVQAVVDAAGGITVIDAAYAEFIGDRWGGHAARTPAVVVLGTLSKAFGLAGARVGYAVAGPEEASILDRLRPPGSLSTMSVALAERALAETAWMEEHVARVVELREALAGGLRSLGLAPRPSVTNFVLCEVGGNAHAVAEALMDRGIVVRTFPDEHPLAHHIRITVRIAEQQERLLEVLGEELR